MKVGLRIACAVIVAGVLCCSILPVSAATNPTSSGFTLMVTSAQEDVTFGTFMEYDPVSLKRQVAAGHTWRTKCAGPLCECAGSGGGDGYRCAGGRRF